MVDGTGEEKTVSHTCKMGWGYWYDTYIVALYVGYRQFIGQVLRNGALATAGRTRDDPHVAVVVALSGTIHLLDRVDGSVVHGCRMGRKTRMSAVDGEHCCTNPAGESSLRTEMF